jgi:GNAT superfamily N-acetyltransferase
VSLSAESDNKNGEQRSVRAALQLSSDVYMSDVREAVLPDDLEAVRSLWLDYLTWGNDELDARYGFRLPIQEAVEHDVATIEKFQPPDGRLLLAFEDSAAVGTACLRRIASNTCEIKRMWVDPSYRRGGVGGALLDRLVATARRAGYQRVRLDSPDFMTAAHGLYRSSGFIDIEPYPESEIPDEYKSHWIFMEKGLT